VSQTNSNVRTHCDERFAHSRLNESVNRVLTIVPLSCGPRKRPVSFNGLLNLPRARSTFDSIGAPPPEAPPANAIFAR